MKRWLVAGGVLLALFAALVATAALLPESPDRLPGSITNARPQGVRALGQVLAANGVDVAQVTTLDEATAATEGSTLAVYLDKELSTSALTRLRDVPADLVVVYAGGGAGSAILTLTAGLMEDDYWWSETDLAAAACADPDASAAATVSAADLGIVSRSAGVVTCFGDETGAALYGDARTTRHRVTVVAGTRWLRNDSITDNGNAALALRVLGRHPRLVWYLPGPDALPSPESASPGGIDVFVLLPPWARTAGAVLLVAGAAAALWRGRRFGALVPEALPVEVPASEAASGLARLYRQAGARGHAAAGLRAATVHRVAARLGLPASASPELVAERLGAAAGTPPALVYELCYGPPPATDAALVELATALTDLERKLTSRD